MIILTWSGNLKTIILQYYNYFLFVFLVVLLTVTISIEYHINMEILRLSKMQNVCKKTYFIQVLTWIVRGCVVTLYLLQLRFNASK